MRYLNCYELLIYFSLIRPDTDFGWNHARWSELVLLFTYHGWFRTLGGHFLDLFPTRDHQSVYQDLNMFSREFHQKNTFVCHWNFGWGLDPKKISNRNINTQKILSMGLVYIYLHMNGWCCMGSITGPMDLTAKGITCCTFGRFEG